MMKYFHLLLYRGHKMKRDIKIIIAILHSFHFTGAFLFCFYFLLAPSITALALIVTQFILRVKFGL